MDNKKQYGCIMQLCDSEGKPPKPVLYTPMVPPVAPPELGKEMFDEMIQQIYDVCTADGTVVVLEEQEIQRKKVMKVSKL